MASTFTVHQIETKMRLAAHWHWQTVQLIIAVSVVSLAVRSRAQPASNSLASDQQALNDLFWSTGGNSTWRNSKNWLVDSSISRDGVCSWLGVGCSPAACLASNASVPCRVTSLVLRGNNLVGTLPASLGSLSALLQLDLESNSLNGELATFTGPRSLTVLRLSKNLLSGPIVIGNMHSLEKLHLSSNLVTGTIPIAIGSLVNLTDLDLSSNAIHDSIPELLCTMSTLVILDLSFNRIYGTLPECMGNLSKLTNFRLSSNTIAGSIPQSFRRLVNLVSLFLDSNGISGRIPEWLSFFPRLSTLQLASNKMSGTIPQSIGNACSLYLFNISFNEISGEIPPSLGNLSKLLFFHARSNRITGELPPGMLDGLSSIIEIDLSSNQLSGSLTKSMSACSANFATLNLADNRISAFSAPALFGCPSLGFIDLSRNQIRQSLDFQNSARLPPLVNLSFNQIGPALDEYSLPPSAFSVSVLDIRSNQFLCPYPSSYPITVSILFSPCAQPWSRILIYFAIFMGSILLLLVLGVAGIRYIAALAAIAQQSQLVVFTVLWLSECVGLILDGLTLQLIWTYLAARIDHCALVNLWAYFAPLIYSLDRRVLCDPTLTQITPRTTFVEFIALCAANGEARESVGLPFDFATLCRQSLPQCDFDPISTLCRTFYPEQESDARGDVHYVFFILVMAVAAVRVLVELVRAACVFASYRRMPLLASTLELQCECAPGTRGGVSGGPAHLHWVAELVSSSAFSPLLYFSSRSEFVVLLLQRDATPQDFMFRAFHAGLLTSMPLLAINLWFLLVVTQYGMAPTGWLSLLKGLILVPRLVFQAFRAGRSGSMKHQRPDRDGDLVLDSPFELYDEELLAGTNTL